MLRLQLFEAWVIGIKTAPLLWQKQGDVAHDLVGCLLQPVLGGFLIMHLRQHERLTKTYLNLCLLQT